jgi:hypothetical protein
VENTRSALHAIPSVMLDDMLGNRKIEVKLPLMKYEDGMLPLGDALLLTAILTLEQPKEVLKIGTYMGHTT